MATDFSPVAGSGELFRPKQVATPWQTTANYAVTPSNGDTQQSEETKKLPFINSVFQPNASMI